MFAVLEGLGWQLLRVWSTDWWVDPTGALDRHVQRLVQIDGSMPRLTAIPPGCAFNPRCSRRMERCTRERPELLPAEPTQAACWLHDQEVTA